MYCLSVSYGQEITNPDSLMMLPDSLLADSVYSGIGIIPADLSFVPAEVMYNCIWDNHNIRYQSAVLPQKTDTIVIPLEGPEDNCFVSPIIGKVISGYRTPRRKNHSGTDVKLKKGDSIYCAFDGKVRLARTFHGYGLLVLVRHHNGLETLYGHLSKILVKENEFIKAGDVVGLGGRTGRATTDHLHFESRLYGVSFNSEKYIGFETAELKADSLFYINGRVETSLSDFPQPKPISTSNVIAGVEAGNGESFSHEIRKGDTLSAIAKKYNTSVSAICQSNNITPRKVLKIGDKLIIK
jgi:murein DD-endopeptidase MepM/ murein hydrolase activator NlpD